jgi:Rieske Fe-S protein
MSPQDSPKSNAASSSEEHPFIPRRRVLEAGVLAAGGAIGLTLVGAGGRFVIGESLASKPAQWVKVGDLANLPPGQMHRATFSVRAKDAWRIVERKGLLYAHSSDGAEYVVLDATCSHLGCNVHWKEERDGFRCPCHDAYFTREGEVISGPPPKPLTRLQTKVEDGVLYALI